MTARCGACRLPMHPAATVGPRGEAGYFDTHPCCGQAPTASRGPLDAGRPYVAMSAAAEARQNIEARR